MKKALVYSSKGLGDGLIFLVISNNLKLYCGVYVSYGKEGTLYISNGPYFCRPWNGAWNW